MNSKRDVDGSFRQIYASSRGKYIQGTNRLQTKRLSQVDRDIPNKQHQGPVLQPQTVLQKQLRIKKKPLVIKKDGVKIAKLPKNYHKRPGTTYFQGKRRSKDINEMK